MLLVFFNQNQVVMKTDYTILLQNEDTIAWKTCIEKEDEFHQNIEFKGKDWNKSFIDEAYPIILNRLQYDKDNWKKYKVEASKNK